MNLFLIVPYFLGIFTSIQTLKTTENNQITNRQNSSNLIIDTKKCYQCNFDSNNIDNLIAKFNAQCKNNTIACNANNFCSSTLSKNEYPAKYILQLDCVSANYCSKFSNKNIENIGELDNSYSKCCNSNLCNNAKSLESISSIADFTEPAFVVNNTPPINSTASSQNIVSNILLDFNFIDYNLDKYCINELFFTSNDNFIITLKTNRCNNKNLSKDDIPFSISQPINKIMFLDKNNKKIYDLLSSDTGITSFNYIKDKNLLFFINDNYAFIYKLDSKKQLTKINQIYLENNPVDIAINYNSTVVAIADEYTVNFYDITQIEQTKELRSIKNPIIGGFNIYRVQYAPNHDVLLVETQSQHNLNTAIYNVENLNKIELIGTVPTLSRQEKPKKINCLLYYRWYVDYINDPSLKWYDQIYWQGSKYRNIHEKSYYRKWIIAPSGNFMINHRIIFACPPSEGLDFLREELYYGYHWNKQINKYGYSVSYDVATNLDMFINRAKTRWISNNVKWLDFLTNIVSVYDSFFSNKKSNLILAIIARESENNEDNRYLFLKSISYPKRDEPYGEVIRQQKEIIRYKLFDLAHSGLFNHDSSKLAIFNDKRIQVYSIHLPKE
jgi:hypothetical protein